VRFLDSETAGFVGPAVIWQHAIDNDPIQIHHVWRRPVRETLQLLEDFTGESICGFNLTFDWFHANKDYNIFRHFKDLSDPPTIAEFRANELKGSREALCLKPASALDLYLYALRGPMQVLMDRDPIVIRRVPKLLAPLLCEELARLVHFDKIHFKFGKDWYVSPESKDPDFPDIVLAFGATAALKPIIQHVFGIETIDFPLPQELRTTDDKKNQYFPWSVKRQWPDKLPGLINYWETNKRAIEYATEDVEHLRRLWYHWGRPEAGDDDSILACAVAATRWKGFNLDRDRALALYKSQLDLARSSVRSPTAVRSGLLPLLSDVEKLVVQDTRAETLEQLVHWNVDGSHTGGLDDGTAIVGDHPAAKYAAGVIGARTAEKRANLAGKLWRVGSFHPDFKILGAKSARMSGAGGLNAHGIDNWGPMRAVFPFAFPGEGFSGGDFDSFEPNIGCAVYGDVNLERDLKSGRKIHGLFGEMAYELDYSIIVANKAAGSLYDRAKKGYLAWSYGGQAKKIATVLDKQEKEITAFFTRMGQRYPQMLAYRERRAMEFCSMRQPHGIGTRVVWHKPAEYVSSLLGDKRYFTLENQTCEALFNLAQEMPREFMELGRFQVKRRDRTQTATGACQSALYAAAFGIQGSNMRAALNHEIQSTGARITKATQRRVWDLQPCGIHAWRVRIMQVHDELLVVHDNIAEAVYIAVMNSIEHFKRVVPLLAITWRKELPDWSYMK
jgi:hypothetical protein